MNEQLPPAGLVAAPQQHVPVDPAIRIQHSIEKFRFQAFDSVIEEWHYYIRRFEIALDALQLLGNDVLRQAARRTLLLSHIGPAPFKMLYDHYQPEEVQEQTYDAIKATLQLYFGKRICYLAERIRFASVHRQEGETADQFVNNLRSVARNCSFGAELAGRLRDQFVIGINDGVWQKEILKTYGEDLNATLAQVVAIAKTMEMAHLQQEQMQVFSKGSKPESNTHRVQQPKFKKPSTASALIKGLSFNGKQTGGKPRQLQPGIECMKCGKKAHSKNESCPAASIICHACNGKGHFASVCISSGKAVKVKSNYQQQRKPKLNRIQQADLYDDNQHDYDYDINALNAIENSNKKALLEISINGINVQMLYDSGASQTVISERIWQQIGSPALESTRDLVAYTNVPVVTLGKATVKVKAFGKIRNLQLCVVQQDDLPLFGLDWCIALNLPMPKGVRICKLQEPKLMETVQGPHQPPATAINASSAEQQIIKNLCKEFNSLFETGDLSTIKGHKAVVHIREDAKPVVFKPRIIPFALRQALELEFDRLTKNDIWEPVDSATTPVHWASPIVTVRKPNGAIRVCGDFKVTINQHVAVDPHPLPRFEEIVAKLNGGRYFSVIDLKDAYLQMAIDDASKKYLIVATHKGYFAYKRLPFGVNFAPQLFQKTMDNILAGIDGTAAYIDDVICTGATIKEHLSRLRQIFERFKQANVRIKLEKCAFLQPSVTYLGHRIDASGIHPTDERIKAIQEMPTPTTITQLKSITGAVGFYGRFIPNLQPICAPLFSLTKKGVKWNWTTEHDRIFKHLKQTLSSSTTLVHYDEKLPIILSADASDTGLGCVIMHKFPDATERPICYASRLLSDVEKRYATIDKEALAIIFGVTKFNQYLYGRKFTLRTDHKPLKRILGQHQQLPTLVTSRLVRWAIKLSAYDYSIEYIAGKNNTTADVLSRLPIKVYSISFNEMMGWKTNVLQLKVDDLPVSKRQLQTASLADSTISKVIAYVGRGWPESKKGLSEELLTYFEKRDALSYEEGLLIWQGRIIIPLNFRRRILHMLHCGHPGASSMRGLAKFYVWWPKIDEEIDLFVKACTSCQKGKHTTSETPLFSWNVPKEAWSRLHIDFAGPYMNKQWLIVVDAYSKWLEVIPMIDITAIRLIKQLRKLFTTFGYPATIVSDNGTQFTSNEFKVFCNDHNIKHIRSTPYHPRTNGLAERAVRTFKERFSASANQKADVDERLQDFLISYRNTPHSTTGRPPSELLFGHRLRTRLDLLKPNVDSTIDRALVHQKFYHDQKAKHRTFLSGEEVWINDKHGKGSQAGIIEKRTGEYSYIVQVNGESRRAHADHLRAKIKITNEQDTYDFDATAQQQPVQMDFQTPEVVLPPAIQDNSTPVVIEQAAPALVNESPRKPSISNGSTSNPTAAEASQASPSKGQATSTQRSYGSKKNNSAAPQQQHPPPTRVQPPRKCGPPKRFGFGDSS